jgi:DNA primase
MAAYVDFDTIKAQVSFEQIFAHYGLAVVRERGSELSIQCPFHNDSRPSLKANRERAVFNCFSCGAKGDLVSFVQRKEGIASGDRNRDRVTAARLIGRWFGITHGDHEAPEREVAAGAVEHTEAADDAAGEAGPESVGEALASNPVLTFRLKLEPTHVYLTERGLRPGTIEHFGIGYCNRGLMKGRIAIPIENAAGLVGYAGRFPGEPPDGTPKYLLPPIFQKSLELYNLQAVPVETTHVVLVEGYWSVFWLWQECGMKNVIAAMGASLSERQQVLLCERFAGVTILFDGD